MAGASLLLLLDDIAAVLDDVAVLTKVAAKKTAGVLGDDLAVNAEKVIGVRADRELPVVWAVAKGSFINKLILVPLALLASVFAPWAITPALLAGGLYLCYEGAHKLVHAFMPSEEKASEHSERLAVLTDEAADVVAFEQRKIKGAIRTDFILSAEIIVLTLGIVASSAFTTQVGVLAGIAIVMTVGVYGLVAAIVKLDDVGLHLFQKQGQAPWLRFQRWLGERLVNFAPWLMKTLGVVGTAAMFMVGGGILLHNVHPVWEAVESAAQGFPDILAAVTPGLAGAAVGVAAGLVVVGAVSLVNRARG